MGTPFKVDVLIGKLVGRYIVLFGCVWDGNVYMYHHSEKLEKKNTNLEIWRLMHFSRVRSWG